MPVRSGIEGFRLAISEDHVWAEVPKQSKQSDSMGTECIDSDTDANKSNSENSAIEVTWRIGKGIDDRRSQPLWPSHISRLPTGRHSPPAAMKHTAHNASASSSGGGCGGSASAACPPRAPTVRQCIEEHRWAYSAGFAVKCADPRLIFVAMLTHLHKDFRIVSQAAKDPLMSQHNALLGTLFFISSANIHLF